ncbi:polymorphic outer membrane protein middle domain-containing protein [Chlamydia pneumoniae]|uniref:Probable outer membrane protein pmp15 n=3 Tax=Chlamydia pneumoniae TaxID=83558 RepID=PMP15_CHLPN|nr:polymorphic outer membrane protein middle domain-containing protein [Chlamydia pneumoniae]Q9Z883.1 RecName: Full=Probable outer membrane protein pmp15; AltName: Full=Polymorphic membrane protein 15; Flags: Precursor [Chlamydia pneumoniae]AAD18608.1 Polymorphic Outer Membrane Protein E Family [Chlamydia pneumoniae CWL029]AAF38143.1 polymorphic membrane protein E/F family [Chlamydia pneumoniae AR39]CRI39223.1 Probable outer membrane protein pmp15 [Chlamydia pneumoniae]CRI52992.1 Probable oute
MRFFCFGMLLPFTFVLANEGLQLPLETYITLSPEYQAAPQVGFTHNQNQDLAIVGNHNDFILDYKYYRSNGGALTCKNLLISENIGNVFFEKNVCPNSGGAIYAAQNCTISKNQNYAFTTNLVSDNPTATAGSLLGGALFAINCSITNNLGQGTFVDNLALNKGGALYTETNLSIKDNKGPIIIKQNRALNSDSLGGGIYSGNSLNIEGNSGAIQITSNSSGSGGGIFSTQTLTISSNKKLIEISENSAFANNYGSNFNPGGGGLTTTFCTILNNREGVLFNNNQSQSNGGAIHAKSIIIKENGPVYFLNNTATRGGALLNLSAGSGNGSFILSADNGDIIFNNNTASKHALNPPYRNAIHSTPNMNLQIGARPGYRVLFYDPIEHELPSSFPILFNFETGHTGTVLFSGEHVHQNFTDEMNFFSYLRNTSELRQGVLAVEDGAGLACYKFFQRGGTLLLGQGAVITTAGTIPTPSSTPTTVGSTITLNHIAIDLPSILSFQAQAPKIWIYPTKTGSTYTEDSNPTITISGTLTLRNSNNEDPYDSLDLSHSLEKVPLLYIVDVAAQKINSSQLDLSTLNSGEHYGYQGIWSTYWVETTTITNPTSLLGANTKHKLLYANWSPLGYRPHPERRGEFITNALWQSAYTALAGLHSLSSWDEEKGHAASLQGIGLLVHQKDKNGFKGFRSHMTGYSATTEATSSQSPNFSLGFAQFFSKAKEHESQNSTSSHHYFSGMCIENTLFKEWIRLSVSLAYMFTSEHTHTMYQGLLEGNSQGSFHNHTLAGALSCVFLPQPHGESLQIYPFITALAIRGNLAAFQESGDHAREFSLHRPLTDVSLPVGIRASWKNHHRVPLVWLTEISYRSTLYRQDPELHSKLLISQGTWTTQATPVTYNALGIKVKNTMQVFPKVTLSLDYSADISSSTLSHYLNVASRMRF